MPAASVSPKNWLQPLRWIEKGEGRAVAFSFSFFFCILGSNYLLRPIRDEMGLRGNAFELVEGFVWTFVALSAVMPFYWWLAARAPVRLLVPCVYRFCSLNLLLLWGFWRATPDEGSEWLTKVVFVWPTAFNVIATTLFWSCMADLFTESQGRRLFGLIAAGGTTGGVVAALAMPLIEDAFSVELIFLVVIGLLEVAILCAARARRFAPPTPDQRPMDDRAARGVFDGLRAFCRSPYLLTIGGYLLCAVFIATFAYFAQREILPKAMASGAERREFLSRLNFWSQLIIVGLQALVAAPLIRRAGLLVALAVTPVSAAFLMGGLAVSPVLLTLAVVDVVGRALRHGIERPSREVLFTVVSRTEKYQAKSIIDNLIFRGGDVLAAMVFTALLSKFGLGPALGLAIPLCAVWFGLAIGIARAHRGRAQRLR